MKLCFYPKEAALLLFIVVLVGKPKPTEPATITVGTGGGCARDFCDDVEGAIASAVSGDIVEVDDGCYVIDAQVVMAEDITLTGQSRENTIISPGFNTGTSGDPRGWFLVNDGVNVDVNSMTFDGIDCSDGTQRLVWQAFRQRGSGTFSDVAFKNIRYQESGTPFQGTAIAAFDGGVVNVINSFFEEIGRIGVLYFGSGTTGLFQGNVYTGKGDGDWLDYALDISAGANIRVEGNTITSNTGVASTDGSVSACLLVSTFFGPGTTATIEDNVLDGCFAGIFVGFNEDDSSDLTISGNTITNNEFGFASSNAPAITGTANRNAIFGNSQSGFRGVDFATPFDITCNWWGSPDGPSGDSTGSGDSVTGTVTFELFLVTADLENAACRPQAPVCDVDFSLETKDSVSGSKKKVVGAPICLETFCEGSRSVFETVCVDTMEVESFVESTGPEGIRFTFGCCAAPLQSTEYPEYCSGLTLCADVPEPATCEFADTCGVDAGKSGKRGKGKFKRERVRARHLESTGRELRSFQLAQTSTAGKSAKGKNSKKLKTGIAACFNGADLCLDELDPRDVASGGLATCGPCGTAD